MQSNNKESKRTDKELSRQTYNKWTVIQLKQTLKKMGVTGSREHNSHNRLYGSGGVSSAMPQHLVNQYNTRHQFQNGGDTAPAAPNWDTSQSQRQQQQQRQQQPAMNNNNNNENQSALKNNSGNNNQRGVQEGQIVKMLATVDASSVSYDPVTHHIKFSVTSECPGLTYEIHTGVKEYVVDGEVFYTPNKPKMEPQRIYLEKPQKNTVIRAPIDVSKLEEKERVYNKHYPKQQPCVIVLRYRTKEMRKDTDNNGGDAQKEVIVEHTEHTAVDLADNPKRRVISQIVTAGGSAYVVEDLFGMDGEIAGAAGGDAEVMLGTTIVPHEGDEDDEGLCVICLTNDKDTAVMPCRHMCLCKTCAEELMRRSPKCPVCRGRVSTLLHMPTQRD